MIGFRFKPLERAAWILAALCIVIAAVAAGKPSFTNASRPVRGIEAPVIALETAVSVGEIDSILSETPSPDREVMRLKQYLTFAFALAYVLLFGLIAVAGPQLRAVGALIAIVALSAGVVEVFESRVILGIIDLKLADTTPSMLQTLRTLSLWKWSLQAASLLSIAALRSTARRWWPRIAGVIALIAAAIIFTGLFRNDLLALATPGLAVALAANAATLRFLNHEPASSNSISRSL